MLLVKTLKGAYIEWNDTVKCYHLLDHNDEHVMFIKSDKDYWFPINEIFDCGMGKYIKINKSLIRVNFDHSLFIVGNIQILKD